MLSVTSLWGCDTRQVFMSYWFDYWSFLFSSVWKENGQARSTLVHWRPRVPQEIWGYWYQVLLRWVCFGCKHFICSFELTIYWWLLQDCCSAFAETLELLQSCTELHHLMIYQVLLDIFSYNLPDSNVHGANMGPIWGQQDPGGPHVGPMNFAIWVSAHISDIVKFLMFVKFI